MALKQPLISIESSRFIFEYSDTTAKVDTAYFKQLAWWKAASQELQAVQLDYRDKLTRSVSGWGADFGETMQSSITELFYFIMATCYCNHYGYREIIKLLNIQFVAVASKSLLM